ncbi:PP2C family serine/threonine-protein phosphatase [Lentzea albida]|uniref:Protein phosphatase 2C n=1 Tax=Lentzea albida TaxID=65499 RepID=A0A1H9UAH3_9PSEU|nr:PP2C family serine/threonine-protein phosphatase [Lentzea albida]SES06465.1 Protein phosphatase 2C [Lentzea albida]
MSFEGASLPGGPGKGHDRWCTTGSAAIVLDGASSFTPATADASEYVDHLMREISARISSPEDLGASLGEAIHATANQLRVKAGDGPSSTVLLARERESRLELLALGDSTAVVKTADGAVHRVTDDRLSRTAADLRRQYRSRLEAGAGYDDTHRTLLGELQRHERQLRNTDQGYWIAEAQPDASREAVRRDFVIDDVAWLVLATDGAQRVIDHLGLSWEDIALMDSAELAQLLQRLHSWEQFDDPAGKFLPRAKQHDDKVLVRWRSDS